MKIKFVKFKKTERIHLTMSLSEGEYAIIKNSLALYGGPAGEDIKNQLEKSENRSEENIEGGVFRRINDK